MNIKLTKTLAATGIAGSLLLGGAGFAMAQSTTPTTTATATATATTRPDRSAALTSALAPLVTAGTITQAQSDAVVKALAAADVGHGGPRGLGGPGGGGFANHADTIASAI